MAESNVINLIEFGEGTNVMYSAYFENQGMGALYILTNQEPHGVNEVVESDIRGEDLESSPHFRLQFSNVESVEALIASLEDVKGMMSNLDEFKQAHKCTKENLNVLSRN